MPQRLPGLDRLLNRVRRHRRGLGIAAGVFALLAASFPWWAGALGASLARSTLEKRLGVPVVIERGRAGLGALTLTRLVVGARDRAPLFWAERLLVPYAAIWGRGLVLIEGARIEIDRGGNVDNVGVLLGKLTTRRPPPSGDPAASAGDGRSLPGIRLSGARVRVRDLERKAELAVGALDVDFRPGELATVSARDVAGSLRLRGGDRDPRFGLALLELRAPLAGLRPREGAEVRLDGGSVQLLPKLGFTGIKGTVKPVVEGGVPSSRRMALALSGSYGGARESLWTATGEIQPAAAGQPLEFDVSLRAARFSLEKIGDILPPAVLEPAETLVDAALDLRFRDQRLSFKGNLDASGVSLRHEALASEPLMKLTVGLGLDGALDLRRRRLELGQLEGRLRDLVGRVSGAVELVPGTFKFTDGSEMAMLPKIELALKVPRLPCAKLLNSVPTAIVPHLRGFVLRGDFEADVVTKIDYANLEALELGGKVGIDGCRVVKAPDEVIVLGGQDSITQVVEVPSAERNAPPGATELLAFSVGSDNPEFVPFDKISPHLINSIMTTEDSGFFRHRGWVTPEFKTALRRNLAGGGFRLGASSITMQMVKNVLLSREKTLSRKLQELFLVWYLEQQLPKERILELYFNAIEFGPRIYGIGPAARHYFGKTASELSPLEAAFFSSILPSPKRRYVQYCKGQPDAKWEKYVRRILARVHERGRMTDEEYAAAAAATLAFDTTERPGNEQECLAWVKKITQRPVEAEPPEGEP